MTYILINMVVPQKVLESTSTTATAYSRLTNPMKEQRTRWLLLKEKS